MEQIAGNLSVFLPRSGGVPTMRLMEFLESKKKFAEMRQTDVAAIAIFLQWQ